MEEGQGGPEALRKRFDQLSKDKEDLRKERNRLQRQIDANKSLAPGLYMGNRMGIV